MNAKKIISMIVCGVILAGGGFAGGVYYQKSKSNTVAEAPNGMPNMPSTDSSNKSKTGMTPPTGNGGPGGGGTSGEIISINDDSFTIKDKDGNTKIVYFSDSTTISKNTTGSKSDLTVGTNVMVSGTTNSDKSVTGKTVMIQPEDVTEE